MSDEAIVIGLETRSAECPSELELDRLALGELTSAAVARVDAHVAECAVCRGRTDLRTSGFEAFAVDADRMFERIQAAEPPTLLDRAKKWFLPELLIPIATATAVYFAVAPARAPDDSIRSKGGTSLRVFRERDGYVQEQSSGAEVRAGDRLRFKVGTKDKQIMIVGAEAKATYVYYPPGESHSGRPELRRDGALVGAVELDDYAGREWIHLIECETPFARRDVRIRAAKIRAPKGCHTATFVTTRGR